MRNVPRGALGVYSSSTITIWNNDENMRLRATSPKYWTKKLPGLSQCLYEDLAKVPFSQSGAEEKGRLQKLCKRLFKAWKVAAHAMRALRIAKRTDASSGLQSAATHTMALPPVSFGPSPNGSGFDGLILGCAS
jgi:hypothetical protein